MHESTLTQASSSILSSEITNLILLVLGQGGFMHVSPNIPFFGSLPNSTHYPTPRPKQEALPSLCPHGKHVPLLHTQITPHSVTVAYSYCRLSTPRGRDQLCPPGTTSPPLHPKARCLTGTQQTVHKCLFAAWVGGWMDGGCVGSGTKKQI